MTFKFDFKRLFGGAADRLFSLGLMSPQTFAGAVRPILLGHSEGDIAKAYELALQGMTDHIHVVKQHSSQFLEQLNDKLSLEGLRVPVAGKATIPVGTAAGLDPDAKGLVPLSMLFGFQVPGPVTVHRRSVDRIPFQESRRQADLYVPIESANDGLVSFRDRLSGYRQAGGTALILPAIVGVCDDGTSTEATQQMETLLQSLGPLVDGAVWYPTFANSGAVMTPEHFREIGALMATLVAEKLKLVALPSYEPDQQRNWLSLVDAFLAGGGDGILAVVGRVVPRSEVPEPAQWPFETALQCGASMAACRQRAIEDARRHFPQAFIAACGGFHSREEAFRACEHANVIMENEAFTRYGPGIARTLLNKLVLRLNYLQRQGLIETADLHAYQQACWKTA